MDIGDRGQTTLQDWASKAGMTCNPSIKDRFGWDFLLETEAPEIDQGIPSDLRSGRLSFFVQVKTTQSRRRSWSMKLSNWDHLVKEPVPTFFLMLHLDENYEISAASLTHIGQFWIERTLQKLRENSGKKLNRIHMSLKADPQDLLAEPYPASMRKRLLDTLDGGFRAYCSRKLKLLEELGYGEFRSMINLSAEGDMQDFVDFAIGAKKRLPVKNVTISDDIRFGLPGSVEQLEEATMEMPPPAYDARLVLSNDTGLASDIAARIFLPNWMIGRVPEDKFKFRLESSVCEGVFGPGPKAKMTFRLPSEMRDASVDSVLPIANALLILSNSESRARLSIRRDDHTILTADLLRSTGEPPSDQLVSFATMVNDLNRILRFFEIPTADKRDFGQLYRQKDKIREIRAFIEYGMRGQLSLGFTLPNQLDESCRIAVPRVVPVVMGRKVLVVVGAYVGAPTLVRKDEQYEYVSIVRVELRRHELVDLEQKPSIESHYEALSREYQDAYTIIALSREQGRDITSGST